MDTGTGRRRARSRVLPVLLTLALVAVLWLGSLGGSWAMPGRESGATITIPPLLTYMPLVISRYWCDPYEPNDTFGEAYGPLVSGTVYWAKLCQGDKDDLYYFDLAAPHSVVIDLTNIPVGTDYDLSLWNSAHTLLRNSRHPGSADEHITINLSRAGRYYVRVHPYTGRSDTQSYALVATYQ